MPYQYMIDPLSDYKKLRRNQMGLNSLDEPQTFLGVGGRRVSVWVVWGVGGGGVRVCSDLQDFDFASRLVSACTIAES